MIESVFKSQQFFLSYFQFLGIHALMYYCAAVLLSVFIKDFISFLRTNAAQLHKSYLRKLLTKIIGLRKLLNSEYR